MISERAGQILVVLMIEAAVSYPDALYRRIRHPVVWIGQLISTLERRWNIGSQLARRVAGCALLLVLVSVAGGAGWLIEWLAGPTAPWTWAGGFASPEKWWGTIAVLLVASTAFAQRSLWDHVVAVLRPLQAGDLEAARLAVGRIVGRDTQELDSEGVSTAAIESLAESFCDGIVAPACWFLVAGLPGLFICKAINTADSMVGHKDDRYRAFGWACARADDLVNLVPARIAALLICIAGASTSTSTSTSTGIGAGTGTGTGASTGIATGAGLVGGLRITLRDAHKHASPNAGWSEAAMAGVLARQLGGPVSYDGELTWRPTFGDGDRPNAVSLHAALRVYWRACLVLWLIIGGVAWRL